MNSHTAVMKKSRILTEETLLSGDSKEILATYYEGRLIQLQRELNQYNLLDHIPEIRAICKKIITTKKKLEALNIKTRAFK